MENNLIRIRASGATNRLVLLHGWGADADDLIPLGQEWCNSFSGLRIELVALRAPQIHPDGCGRQWYGLFPPQWDEVPSSIENLTFRIQALCSSAIPLERTALFGFSQGAAMAMGAGSQLKLAGLICCSGYPHPDWTPPQSSPPVLLCHGNQDEVVPCEASRKLFRSLRNNKIETDLVIFDGGHEIPQNLFPSMERSLQRWFA